jgi:UDP-N-acetylglucosamine--N-acetylmuramyl-(pentapeptide) pyrophosphoryl-undecaprenol N-acetylglucosamine transferase
MLPDLVRLGILENFLMLPKTDDKPDSNYTLGANVNKPIFLAASVGGHLELLEALVPALEGRSRAWVTTPGSRPQSLRDRGETVHLLSPLDRKSLSIRGIFRGVILALRLRPEVVITSGAGVVGSFCLTARLLGARLMFVETMARVDRGSATGRLLAPLAERILVQWPEMRVQHPSARVCRPLLLEDLPPIAANPGVGTFVSVGSHPQPFKRLLDGVAKATDAHVLPWPVLAQVGAGALSSTATESVDYLQPDQFLEAVSNASVVICHAGAGVIATVLRRGMRPIVMGRRIELGEHVDDHQSQLLKKLVELDLIVEVTGDITQETVDATFVPKPQPVAAFSYLPSVLDEIRDWLAGRSSSPSGSEAEAAQTHGVVALAWGAHTDRANELAEAVGGQSRSFSNLGLRSRGSAPARWVINGLRTSLHLTRRRPHVVIVQNPPIFLGLLALLYCKLANAELILDSHPTAFGRKGTRIWKLLLPVHRCIARRSAGVLVTETELLEQVRSWGATGLIVHEAPPLVALDDDTGRSILGSSNEGLRILFVAVFAPDEPVDEVIEAVLEISEVRLFITGRLDRAPVGLLDKASEAVTFTGFLDGSDYQRALRECDIVLALTTESTSVMRAAYEAVYAGKPLIVSDWPILRETFPYAVFTQNSASSIAEAIRNAKNHIDALNLHADDALQEQRDRWHVQRSALADLISRRR